jgi:regulatory protein
VALQYARDIAWRALNRRDRSVEEMRTMLAGKRVEPASIDQVVAELTELGHLDDARYAQRFTEDRRRLDAWGNERIARRLRMLGVAAEHIERASVEPGAGDEMERAVALLRRRFPQPPVDDRERSRALGLLVRRGYESEAAYEAIRRYERD